MKRHIKVRERKKERVVLTVDIMAFLWNNQTRKDRRSSSGGSSNVAGVDLPHFASVAHPAYKCIYVGKF